MTNALTIKPTGKLKKFISTTEKTHVHVHRVGKRCKFIDETGDIFVKVFGRVLKFPEQVSY